MDRIRRPGVPALGNEDVGGFYIPMNNPRRMCRIQSVGDFDRKRQQQIGFQGSSSDTVLQHCAIQKLHGDKGSLVLLADVINRADVGVAQRGGRLSFAAKTGKNLRVTGNVFGQEFEGDKTLKPRASAL